MILAKQAENASVQESASFTIKSVQTWRAVLRRAVAWKTARYTKGDIEATVVGITDADGTVGYGYMPSMSIVGESPLSSESLIQTLLVPVMKDRSFVGIQPVLREIEQVLGANFQTKFRHRGGALGPAGEKTANPAGQSHRWRLPVGGTSDAHVGFEAAPGNRCRSQSPCGSRLPLRQSKNRS
jgi:hypothetical protein